MNEENKKAESMCCATITDFEKEEMMYQEHPNLLNKYQYLKGNVLFDAIDKVILLITKSDIDVLARVVLIELLNHGDIVGPTSKVATDHIVLKLTKNGEYGLFTLMDNDTMRFSIGAVPPELIGKIKPGKFIEYWCHGEYFLQLDDALKALKKLER